MKRGNRTCHKCGSSIEAGKYCQQCLAEAQMGNTIAKESAKDRRNMLSMVMRTTPLRR